MRFASTAKPSSSISTSIHCSGRAISPGEVQEDTSTFRVCEKAAWTPLLLLMRRDSLEWLGSRPSTTSGPRPLGCLLGRDFDTNSPAWKSLSTPRAVGCGWLAPRRRSEKTMTGVSFLFSMGSKAPTLWEPTSRGPKPSPKTAFSSSDRYISPTTNTVETRADRTAGSPTWDESSSGS